MRIWRWLKRMCFRKGRCFVVRRMPVALERASGEAVWAEDMAEGGYFGVC
ncbi:MAG: hypothetical protein IJR68_04635 [Fretibacterium sp.]|nr:hypothetical protein [Fretibacterium sp.]